MSRLDERRAEEPASPLDDFRIVRRGLWVTFESSVLEAEYWQASCRRAYTLVTAYGSAVLLGLAVFSIDDYRLFGWTALFARLAALRLCLVMVSLAMLWRIRQRPSRRQLEWLTLLWAVVLVTGHGVIASTRPIDYLVTLANGRAVVLLGFLMVPSPWAVMTPASLVLSAFLLRVHRRGGLRRLLGGGLQQLALPRDERAGMHLGGAARICEPSPVRGVAVGNAAPSRNRPGPSRGAIDPTRPRANSWRR